MSILQCLGLVEEKLPLFLPTYVEARQVRPEFLPYASPADVLAALKTSSALPAAERYALAAAIVAEHQARPHALWSSLLVLAFAPMLSGLRSGITRLTDEEADHRVILAFLEAVARTKPDRHFAIAVRRATANILFAPAAEDPLEFLSFEDEQHSPSDFSALREAELRIDAAWAAKQAARLHREPPLAPVRPLPRRRRSAA